MIDENLYQGYLKALLAGQRAECHATVQGLLDSGIEIKELYDHLFQRSLYQVGELWEQNKISVAKEHLATSITEGLLNLVYPRIFATERVGKKAVVSCGANEFHQIGGKMVADILELNGWDGHFLGANTPIEDLLNHVEDVQPDIVALSLSILSNKEALIRSIDSIQGDFPQMDILVGGQAFRHGGTGFLKNYSNVEFLPSLRALELQIQSN